MGGYSMSQLLLGRINLIVEQPRLEMCGYCGGAATYETNMSDGARKKYYAACKLCGATGSHMKTLESAAIAWNRVNGGYLGRDVE